MKITKINLNLINDLRKIISNAKNNYIKSINVIMLQTYWNIGRRLVEEEQKGAKHAKYGSSLLKEISMELTSEFGKGYSRSNLQSMRLFYLNYKKCQTVSGKLSWSHYLLLMSISNLNERSFYEHECINSNWSVRELERQIDSSLYNRLLLTKGKITKNKIATLVSKGITLNKPDSFIKDPMVIEFLGINRKKKIVKESDLETALIKHIEEFILELGRGFMYVGSQQRITIGGFNYYVDMVFYNKILKSYVLIDLKIGRLKPENFGQMNMYVNYYKEYVNQETDCDPIGIILCADKDKKVAEISMRGLENNIYAAKYQYVMPDKDLLENEVRMVMLNFKNK